ncbi:hypothetical protein MHYP_G00203290 [Metynnis hypsauchen]
MRYVNTLWLALSAMGRSWRGGERLAHFHIKAAEEARVIIKRERRVNCCVFSRSFTSPVMTQLVTWGQLELPWVSALSPSFALTLTPDGAVKNNAERNTTATFIPHIESLPCWLSIWAVEIEAAAPGVVI